MNERRHSEDTRNRLDVIHDGYRRANRILLLNFVLTLFICCAGYWLISENRHRSQEIQNQRRDSILSNCQESNMRNKDTVRILKDRIDVISKGVDSQRVQQLTESSNFTILLVNALAPVKNCHQLVKESLNVS